MEEYVIAPAGANAKQSIELRKCIELIGSTQPGKGSDYAKGRNYLRSRIGCSGACIKHLFKPIIKLVGRDFERHGIYVYKCHDVFAPVLLRKIINELIENVARADIEVLWGNIEPGQLYINLLFWKQMDAIAWTRDNNYLDQYECAKELWNDLNSINDKF